MKLTPEKIRQLVEIAFVMEPIINKMGLTTRYIDLPNKPLADFLISGINVGTVFEEYVESVLYTQNVQLFSHFSKAVRASNQYKSKKYISLGLIQFMFITVKVRLSYKTLSKALQGFLPIIMKTTKQDLICHEDGIAIAWTTSTNEEKKHILHLVQQMTIVSNNLYEGFLFFEKHLENHSFSGYQVAEEYLQGFPTIKRIVQEIDNKKGLLKSIEDSYNLIVKGEPDTNLSLLADFTACAIFLYLSYQDPEQYVVK